jgi:hypothetical protein
MPCDYKKYAPTWRTEIVPRILKRAGYRCEGCGIPQHAIGFRDVEEGAFIALRGNLVCDAAGRGQHPNGQILTHREAKEFTEQYNDHDTGKRKTDARGNHWIVVVLTVAHLNHDTQDNRDSNLVAWCQACHNRHDTEHRQANAKRTRQEKKGAGVLTLAMEGMAI